MSGPAAAPPAFPREAGEGRAARLRRLDRLPPAPPGRRVEEGNPPPPAAAARLASCPLALALAFPLPRAAGGRALGPAATGQEPPAGPPASSGRTERLQPEPDLPRIIAWPPRTARCWGVPAARTPPPPPPPPPPPAAAAAPAPSPALAMGLRESPYASPFLGGLDTALRSLLFPTYWLASQLLALKQTTAEKQARERQPCPPFALQALARVLALLPLLLLSFPFALVAFLAWLPLQAARRPFAYQRTAGPALPDPGSGGGGEGLLVPGKARAFSFLTSNVCLLPEGLARFSNLARTQWRAKHIARALARAAHHSSFPRESASTSSNGWGSSARQKYGALESRLPRSCQRPLQLHATDVTIEMPVEGQGEAPAPGEITALFPPRADFVCLQEVFDSRAAAHLRHLLGSCYGHIIYDVGTYGLVGCSAPKLLNSGLFVASRYPVLAVQYRCYPNGTKEDALAAKGLLCVQVQLGTSHGQRIVGYLNCTHLHAPEADGEIRCDQLNLALLWAQLFQDASAQPGDIVAFDVFCGDLNFDNCSPGDEMEQAHQIFDLYTDPCRLGPQKDQPWAIGTLMDYLEIYDEAVSTPENMQRTLERPEGRQKYLAGPVLADGEPDLSGASSDGRRLDYILYREPPGPLALTTVVEKASFITRLATCSDHLPFGLRLLVTCAAQPEV